VAGVTRVRGDIVTGTNGAGPGGGEAQTMFHLAADPVGVATRTGRLVRVQYPARDGARGNQAMPLVQQTVVGVATRLMGPAALPYTEAMPFGGASYDVSKAAGDMIAPATPDIRREPVITRCGNLFRTGRHQFGSGCSSIIRQLPRDNADYPSDGRSPVTIST